MVKSKKLDTKNIISAMESGDFYSSTGVHLKKLSNNQKKISLIVDSEPGINYEIIFLGYQINSEEVVELKNVQGTSASYNYQKEDIFVRVRITSDAKKNNPILDNETKKAWTQPFLLR